MFVISSNSVSLKSFVKESAEMFSTSDSVGLGRACLYFTSLSNNAAAADP